MALVVRSTDALKAGEAPAWVGEWLGKRTMRAEAKVADAPVKSDKDSVSKQGTANDPIETVDATRMKRMAAGVGDFEKWLLDAMRIGLAALDTQPMTLWEARAAQLVDAQLPGLAAAVRALAGTRGPERPSLLLARLGELYLLVQSFQRLPLLPQDAKAEVLQQLGVNLKKEDISSSELAVRDKWYVHAQITTQEDRLTARRTWLWGAGTERYAVLLDYAFAGQGFDTTYLPRRWYEGQLTYYPGLYPLRGLPGSLVLMDESDQEHPAALTILAALQESAQALSANPWLRIVPMNLCGVVPERHKNAWYLRQLEGILPLACTDEEGWHLAAESGGNPLQIFGEWDGSAFSPHTYKSLPTVEAVNA